MGGGYVSTGYGKSAAHCQAMGDAKRGVISATMMGNTNHGQPVDLTQRGARLGVFHCRCGCGQCDSSGWYAKGMQCASCYQKARRNVKAGRNGADIKGVSYCAPM